MKKFKNNIIKGTIVLYLVLMMMFPHASFDGASSGLLLWFHHVLPNLLPFIIISNLMVHLNITSQISRVFHPLFGRLFGVSIDGCYPIVFGFLSGIPMGAKSTADMVLENKIHRREGQFLLGMCNNASPMFILGYIAITQLKLPHIKYALFVILYGSAILAALIYRALSHRIGGKAAVLSMASIKAAEQKNTANVRFSFEILDSSIMNGFEIITKVGGYIILFSILAQIINAHSPGSSLLKAALMGVLEITTGISQICKSSLDSSIKIVLVAVITSFGGLSGIAQTKSVLANSGLSIKSYLIVKLISTVITLVLALLYVNFGNI